MDYLKETALYFQIKQAIKQYINDNHLKTGDRLPSENEFLNLYQVSRITLRRALDELLQEGYISKVQGKGTFVSAPHIQAQLSYLSSFTEDMSERGIITYAQVLDNKIIDPPADVIDELRLTSGSKVVFIQRVRYAGNNPIALEKCYLAADRFSDITGEDLTTQSLNKLMQDKYQVSFSYASQLISTHISEKPLMKLLGLSRPTSILSMKRTVMDIYNSPVQYTLSYYRGDIYEYKVILPMQK